MSTYPYKQRLTAIKESSDKAWEGLDHLPEKFVFEDFNAQKSAEIAREFKEKRVADILRSLQEDPYVFLAGPTGVGKTTFVRKELPKDVLTLYQSKAQMEEWALDKSDKVKVLLIDEANLIAHLNEFEGLFNKPVGILINGKYHTLSDKHKVIFAGNPVSYGDERKLASFFARHGNALVFKPLPLEFIYEEILKPVFEGTPLEGQSSELCLPFLTVYRFLCECSTDRVLISPRELQMMALMVLSNAHQRNDFSQKDSLIAAQYFAYELSKNLVPENNRAAFDAQFKPKVSIVSPKASSDTFLITKSRQPICQQIDELLELREFRCKGAANDAQRFGGLGALVLEGEPGVGKSEMLFDALLAKGYQEAHKGMHLPEKPFYRIPVSMSLEKKKKLLLKAFHQGAVVLIDEINSSPMMESLFNDLLMGKTPEGKSPDKPGFLLLATQNPITMAGRREASIALKAREICTLVPPYTHDEMEEILGRLKLPKDTVGLLVAAYEKKLKQALEEHRTPAPTFRDLLKFAKRVLKGLEHKPQEKIPEIKAPLKEPEVPVHQAEIPITEPKTPSRPPQKSAVTSSGGFFTQPAQQQPLEQPPVQKNVSMRRKIQITAIMDDYIDSRTSFLKNLFRNTRLTQFKVLLAQSFLQAFDTVHDYESIKNITEAMENLNLAIEEYSKPENINYHYAHVNINDLQLKEAFKNIMESWPISDRSNLPKNFPSQYRDFASDLITRMSNMKERGVAEHRGKEYTLFRSSGLAKASKEILEIMESENPQKQPVKR